MTKTNVTVALLISELSEAREISAVFKKLGVIPYFYETLKEFWQGTLELSPTLSIVDVRMMNEGSLILKNHPAVAVDEMPMAFYYSEATEALLVSTHHYFHYGLIKKTDDYETILAGVLKRVNKISNIEEKVKSLEITLEARKDQIVLLERALKEETDSDNYRTMVKTVCMNLENERTGDDFYHSLEKVFYDVPEVTEYAFFEVSLNGQKLISSTSRLPKNRTLPSIWLGQTATKGIEEFAQNMATQVATEAMEGNLVSLLIKGTEGTIEKMLFVKTDNELFYNNFDWNMLEAYLHGYNVSFSRQNQAISSGMDKKLGSTFQAMSYLDQFLFGQTAGEAAASKFDRDVRLVNLDLSDLVRNVLKKGTNRFFWNRFLNDFMTKFEIHSGLEFKYFDFGVFHIGFFVKAEQLDIFFDQLKAFSKSFAYWKYFEDTDGVLSLLIEPVVTMSPLSAHAYLTKTLDIEQKLKDSFIDHSIGELPQERMMSSLNRPKITLDM